MSKVIIQCAWCHVILGEKEMGNVSEKGHTSSICPICLEAHVNEQCPEIKEECKKAGLFQSVVLSLAI